MNKEDFLEELSESLNGLPQSDIDDRITFYRELIYERMKRGQSEEEVISSLGSVNDIVFKIMSEYPLSTLVKQKVQPQRKLEPWLIILLVLGSPLWFPLLLSFLIVFVTIVFSLYIVVWSLVFSLFAMSFAFASLCVGGIIAMFSELKNLNFVKMLFFFGVSLASAGLAIFLFIAGTYFAKAVIILSRKCANAVKNLFVGKKATV